MLEVVQRHEKLAQSYGTNFWSRLLEQVPGALLTEHIYEGMILLHGT